jgi:hypothetical protein
MKKSGGLIKISLPVKKVKLKRTRSKKFHFLIKCQSWNPKDINLEMKNSPEG